MPENQKLKELLNKSKSKTTASSVGKTKQTTSKVSAKNKVVTTSKTAEATSKEKVLATQAAYNTAVEEKSLSKTQKAVIATGLTLAVATAVIVPLSMHIINSNSPFDITISSNYHKESIENDSLSVEPGTLISELTPIYREGFVFKGWYRDANCTELYPLDYEIKEDDVVYALLEVEVVDITLNVYINGQLTTINTQSGKTLEQALEENGINFEEISIPGHHLVGLFKDPQGEKTYPNGYIIKKTDSTIYALFEMNTYLITFPEVQEGYYIMDTAGNQITSTQRVTYGQDFSFKVFIADGYFGNDLRVVANTEVIEAENETYTFTNIGSNFNIEITGVKSIEDISFTVALNGVESTIYHTTSDMTFKEFFGQVELPYTEETTAGIFTNAELTESILFDTTIDKDATYYIHTATLEKLAFTEVELTEEEIELCDGITSGYLVSALNYDITGDVVIPAYYNGKPVIILGESAFCNMESQDPDTELPIPLNISSIVLPNTLKVIGPAALALLPVEDINIPEGVTTIGEVAFAYTQIKSVNIPSSIVTIGDSAFAGCEKLTIYCPSFGGKPSTWDMNWNPSNCPVVWDESRRFAIDNWVGYFGEDEAILEKYTGNSVDVVIPKEINGKFIKRINDGLFENANIIESIYVPSTIEYVKTYSYQISETNYGYGSFLVQMSKLENIYFEGENSEWNRNWRTSYSHTMGNGGITKYKHVIYNVKEVRQNDKWKYVVHNNDTITLVKYIGGKQHVIVPVSIDGMNVTTLNYKLLDNNITKICLYKTYTITAYNYYNGERGGVISYYYPFTGCSNLTIYLSHSDYTKYNATTGWNKYSDTGNCPVSIISYEGLMEDYDRVTSDWDV